MLLFVQCVQISRATTTYEAMRGHFVPESRASEALTAALTSGSTSMDGAQLARPRRGRKHSDGFFAQWKKLLGLDAFMTTAQQGIDGSMTRRRQNPYSRGIYTNCRDFWCDPGPLFGKRETGEALLDGDVVDYTKLYETPSRIRARVRQHGSERYNSIV